MEPEIEKITISWDEIERVDDSLLPANTPIQAQPTENQSWGTVGPSAQTVNASGLSQGSLYLKAWFYLGLAGLVGAFLAWMVCEPSFEDGGYSMGWGNVWIFPLMVILMSVGYGMAESAVERSWTRALLRGLGSVGLGLVLGFLFYGMANIVYGILTALLVEWGAEVEMLDRNPAFWLVRGIAWAVFGVAGGLIFGIVSKSGKKILYGMLGGAIGAGIGGLFFDPISLLTGGAEASRAIGMSILGASTGVAIGLVESALKDRWLYVSVGPLAGKQFILYHDQTTIGKQQSCTIYLFKDPSILDQHAVIEHRGARTFITAYGDVVVSGQPLRRQTERVLMAGDTIQIGQYMFKYSEKTRKGKAV